MVPILILGRERERLGLGERSRNGSGRKGTPSAFMEGKEAGRERERIKTPLPS